MINAMRVVYAAVSLLCFVNWSVQDRNIEGRPKPQVNFYGTLVTHSEKQYSVEYITIGGEIRQIPLYETPGKKTGRRTIETQLSTDPTQGVISKIDLVEVQHLGVKDPKKILIWEENNNSSRRNEYVELTITFKNNIKRTFLVNINIKILCDEVVDGAPVEMDVPIQSIKQLTIEGYSEFKKQPEKNRVEKKKTVPA